jgi:uncharacterized lipoprotein YddW (UPF0748 family)
MKRRDFVAQVGGAAAALSLGGYACRPERTPLPAHWAWVHGGRERTPEEWRAAFARIRDAGLGGVHVGGGDVELISAAARDEGVAFHRWIWTLNRAGDQWAREHHPEWYTVSRDGKSSLEHPPYVGYYKWFCPTRPAVREYLREEVDELAGDPDVGGVHLDYVRHSDVILPRGLWSKYGLTQDREYPEFDFCYCDVCRETFAAEHGTDPLDFPDPTADVAWRRFRWDSVTGLVRVLADAVHAHGKPISAAVFPTPTIARRLVRQAWDEWPLDAFFPMLYHEFYEKPIAWIGSAVGEGVAALEGRASLHAGLFLPSLPDTALATAARTALDSGADGVALFELGSLDDARLAPLRREIAAG